MDANIVSGKWARVFIAILIIVDLVASIWASFNIDSALKLIFQSVTYFSAIVFTVEYVMRIRCAKPRAGYLFSFFGFIDLVAILPFTMPLILGESSAEFFDVARMFLVFKLVRYSKSFLSMIRIFHTVYKELLATFFFIGVMLCFCATLMFYIESKAQPEVFNNVGQGFWWAVITFTSVGYGDIFPITPWGKVVGSLAALLGVLMFAIPTGIVSSAFIKYYNGKDK